MAECYSFSLEYRADSVMRWCSSVYQEGAYSSSKSCSSESASINRVRSEADSYFLSANDSLEPALLCVVRLAGIPWRLTSFPPFQHSKCSEPTLWFAEARGSLCLGTFNPRSNVAVAKSL